MGKLTSTERKILEKFFKEHPEEVVELIEEILEKNLHRSLFKRDEVEECVADFLTEIGVPKNIKGYEYLSYTLYLIIKDDKKSFMITREVYPIVATKYHTTSANVERCIRTAVQNTFVKGNNNKKQKLIFKKNATPSEFVVIAAEEVKKRLQ